MLSEEYVISGSIVDHQEFHKFGLTDCGISVLAQKRYLLLTDDFRLSQYAESNGVDAIDFNHIRVLYWNQG